MQVKRIQRVVIVVRNLEEAATRYTELLGANFMDFGIQERDGVRAMVSEDWLVEIISPIRPECAAARYLEKHGEGVMGVAFEVADIGEARQRVDNKGFTVLDEIDFGAVDIWKSFKEIILHPKDTHGAPIMLVEAQPK